MEFLKNKAAILLIVMVLGVSYIGGLENNNHLEETHEDLISANA